MFVKNEIDTNELFCFWTSSRTIEALEADVSRGIVKQLGLFVQVVVRRLLFSIVALPFARMPTEP